MERMARNCLGALCPSSLLATTEMERLGIVQSVSATFTVIMFVPCPSVMLMYGAASSEMLHS